MSCSARSRGGGWRGCTGGLAPKSLSPVSSLEWAPWLQMRRTVWVDGARLFGAMDDTPVSWQVVVRYAVPPRGRKVHYLRRGRQSELVRDRRLAVSTGPRGDKKKGATPARLWPHQEVSCLRLSSVLALQQLSKVLIDQPLPEGFLDAEGRDVGLGLVLDFDLGPWLLRLGCG